MGKYTAEQKDKKAQLACQSTERLLACNLDNQLLNSSAWGARQIVNCPVHAKGQSSHLSHMEELDLKQMRQNIIRRELEQCFPIPVLAPPACML